jgi:hypothetical protein
MSKTVKVVIAMFLCILMLGLCACGAFDWYSDSARYRQINESAVSKQMRGYSLKMPNGHTQNIDGIEYKFTFSRSSYKLGKVVKMRITVTNNSDHEVWIGRKNTTARFVRGDGEQLFFEIVDKTEWVNEFAQNIPVDCFEPGDSIVYERAVALPSDFFNSEGEYCLAFDFDTYIDAMWVGTYAEHNVTVPVQLMK